MTQTVKVHGGMKMLGSDPSIQNLELEELQYDPPSPHVGRIWINTTEQAVKTVLHLDSQGAPVIAAVALSDALQQVQDALAAKADAATTLAGYGITDGVSDDDKRLERFNTKVVSKTPGKGQYNRIVDAINSITDAAADNEYLIIVSPGTYIEPQLPTKPYVWVRGAGANNTVIDASDTNTHLVLGAVNAGIADVTLTGATGTDQALVYMDDGAGSTTQVFRLERVHFGAADTLVHSHSGYVTITSSTLGELSSFTHGFVARDNGTLNARIALRNVSTNGMTEPFPSALIEIDGIHSQILIIGSMARASTSIDVGSGVGTGVYMRNGARLRAIASSLVGFAKGIWVENAGAGSTLECVGINLSSNTMDLVIDHPDTQGGYAGTATRARVSVNPAATNFTVFYTDEEAHGIVNVGPLFIGKTHDLVTDLEPLISRGMQTGLLDGGVLSRLGGLQIQAGAGTGYVKINEGLLTLSWPDTTLTATANLTQYVFVDSTGVLKLSEAIPDGATNIVLGRFLASATDIVFIGSQGSLSIENFNPNLDKFLRFVMGPMYVSGSVVTENATTPRAVDVTTGYYFYSTEERFPDAAVAPNMLVGYHAGGLPSFAMWSVIDNTQYDNGTDLVPLTPGYYTKHTLYTNGNGANVGFTVAHGIGNYATLEEAVSGPLPPTVVNPDGTPMIAAIIVQEGNPNIVQIIDVRPRASYNGYGTSGVVVHGDLLGLDRDDHKQYLRVDGVRALQGPMDANNNVLLNVASINGLNISQHASRHLPNGADPIATAPAVTLSASSANGAGVANSFARSDHTHQITGFQPSSAILNSVVAITGSGVVKRDTDGNWIAEGLTAAEIPVLDWSKVTNTPTTLAGYGITDAVATKLLNLYQGRLSPVSGTSTTAFSNNVPAATDGTQIASRTVTPVSAQSSFLVQFSAMADAAVQGKFNNSSANVAVMLFRQIGTGTPVFIGLGTACIVQQDNPGTVSLLFEDMPATTQPVTYSFRAAVNGSTAWYLGRSYSYTFGGAGQASYAILEVSA